MICVICCFIEHCFWSCSIISKDSKSTSHQTVCFFSRQGHKDQKWLIAMQDVTSYIGGTMSLTLPVVYAFSGCDSTSSLLGLRKNHWLTDIIIR